MPFDPPRPAMFTYRDSAGRWKVGDVPLEWQGKEKYSVVGNPRPVDGGALPPGRPFSCVEQQYDGSTGWTTALLRFDESYIQAWHDHPADPFDARRSVKLTMAGTGIVEALVVDLWCASLHPSSFSSLARGACSLLLGVFKPLKPHLGGPPHSNARAGQSERVVVKETNGESSARMG